MNFFKAWSLRGMVFVELFFLGGLHAVSLEKRWEGFERPIFLEQLPINLSQNKSSDFLIAEQGGKVFQISGKQKNIVLDWGDKVSRKGNEEGLLGLAVSPDFAKTGQIYLNLTSKKGFTEIWRVTLKLEENLGNYSEGESQLLMSFKQPYQNHNGGWIGFGPDRMLYIATGDGGSGNDPQNRAQNLRSYFGKILRIKVIDVVGGSQYEIPEDNPFLTVRKAKPEIFAYGLRNPWRCSWDMVSKSLIIADVGQNETEEINMVSLKHLKGANFGWRLREGNHKTPKKRAGGDRPEKSIEPIYTYSHDASEQGGWSVTGGYLYRGVIEALRGRYVFADYVLPRVWLLGLDTEEESREENVSPVNILPTLGEEKVGPISSFSVDLAGELYLLSFDGNVYQFVE